MRKTWPDEFCGSPWDRIVKESVKSDIKERNELFLARGLQYRAIVRDLAGEGNVPRGASALDPSDKQEEDATVRRFKG